MKVTFLGTGTSSGIPLIGCKCDVCLSTDSRDNRLRTSILVEINDKTFVIDTGPDFRQQMLREKVENLTAVIFTHEHKDHTAGFDDIRAYNFIHKKKIEVYGSENVHNAIKKEYSYIFSDTKYPGIPEINLHLIKNENFEIEGVQFTPVQVLHHKMQVFGFRIGNFTYITDANHISDEEKKKIIGSKVLVLNALRHEKHISHFTLDEAVALVNELKPEKAYFTHISHQLGLHSIVQQLLPDNIFIAYDGLKIAV